ncbi:hypothetical protein [Streptomyces scabiei]|uniref:hypothetical protein n=1 Tax=Streptomyces scabiei TaxID=1930 RepID=UPI00068AB1A5|nr:hypothetical protein [Streptomyces scabiei]MDX2829469.1 hypothetical protein [Streptomyces scabiei]MDX3674975.1 hypothetical protein [Streptomyces scabiei]
MLNTDPIKATTTHAFGLMATPAVPCILAGQAIKPRLKAVTKTVNVAIGRTTGMQVPCEYWATTDTEVDYGHGYEACYDPKQISLADAEQWVRTQLDQQGVHVAEFINEDADDDTRLTHKAAAVYLANELYTQALTQDDPAKTLDDIADALPDVMPAVFKATGTSEQLAAALLPEVADRIWAFVVVAHARAEVGDDYGYVLDVLADNVRHGRDPQAVRDEVPQVVAKIRASRIVGRLWEARDAAEGPWAQMLDVLLAAIEEGADPQAVCDQALGLMQQVRAEKTAA